MVSRDLPEDVGWQPRVGERYSNWKLVGTYGPFTSLFKYRSRLSEEALKTAHFIPLCAHLFSRPRLSVGGPHPIPPQRPLPICAHGASLYHVLLSATFSEFHFADSCRPVSPPFLEVNHFKIHFQLCFKNDTKEFFFDIKMQFGVPISCFPPPFPLWLTVSPLTPCERGQLF